MREWSFLTNHAQAVLLIADQPDVRMRDLADALEVTERTAYGIVADLTAAGYVVKERDGRRNRYHLQDHLPLRNTASQSRTLRELLDLLVEERPRPGDPPRTAQENRRARPGNKRAPRDAT
jgi:DNA-binding MarR family transcriptional regulator